MSAVGRTYSFKDLVGALVNTFFGFTLPITGGNIGTGSITITMATDRTTHDTAADGVVDLWGTITNDEERHAIRVVAENTPGVKGVNDRLVYIEPYTGTVIDAPDVKS